MNGTPEWGGDGRTPEFKSFSVCVLDSTPTHYAVVGHADDGRVWVLGPPECGIAAFESRRDACMVAELLQVMGPAWHRTQFAWTGGMLPDDHPAVAAAREALGMGHGIRWEDRQHEAAHCVDIRPMGWRTGIGQEPEGAPSSLAGPDPESYDA